MVNIKMDIYKIIKIEKYSEKNKKEKNFKKLSFFIQNVIYRSDWNIQLFGNLLRF